MVLRVIPEMASLAHCLKIFVPTVGGIVIEMRDGQNDCAIGPNRGRLMTLFASPFVVQPAFASALATPLRSLKSDAMADSPPVFRVESAVFRSYRHNSPDHRSADLADLSRPFAS